ncbi:MAG TPA: MFS transporter [Candidatus Acidoferrales bacterium]|jgi:predicted MFS family arabinose efflux permease|nr:MFS transporter [Candidatus Acidoferrales bacterium]
MNEPSPTIAEESSISRTTVWFMAASTGVIVANIYYIQPLLADIARAFGLTVTKVGFIAMLTQIGTALGMLFFVPLGDSRERRSLITLLLVIATVGLVFVALARNAAWLALASFVVGMMGATVHLFVPFAAHLAPPRERGRVVGTVFSGILLGILLARTFSGSVGAHLGWRSVYFIAAAMMLCVAILVQFLLPRSKPAVELPYLSLLRSTAGLIREHRDLREAAFLGGCLFCCFSAFWTTLVFFLGTPPYHYGAEAAGLFGLIGAGGAAGAPLFGRLADRRGPRFAVGLAMLSVLVSFGLMWIAGKILAGLIFGVLLMDMGTQAGHIANQTRIYGLDADARSRLNMFYMVCYFVGGAIGSLLGAYAWRVRGWTGVCVFCLGVMIVALAKFAAGRSAQAPAAALTTE